MEQKIMDIIKQTGIVAILRGISQEQVLPTVEALKNAGVCAVEITLNTPNASEMIRKVCESFGKDILVGAGTVITVAQVDEAVDAGAQFMLAPNFDKAVVDAVKRYGKFMVPGALTPTEIATAYQAGGNIIKVFPVNTLGPQYIKDILGPYDKMPLMAVGGITLANTYSFIKAGALAVGVGGSLVSKEHLATSNYQGICDVAKEFLVAVQRGKNT